MVADVPITPTGPSPAANAAFTPDSIMPCTGTFRLLAKVPTAKAEAVLQAATILSAPFASRKSIISRL
jgi:hypothetical protein